MSPFVMLSTSPVAAASPAAPKVADSSTAQRLRKTVLCRYAASGCRNGAQCEFAHEKSELRRRPDFTKTTLCPAWSKGSCGRSSHQCQFAHGQDELRRRNGKHKSGAGAMKQRPDALAPVREFGGAGEVPEDRPSMATIRELDGAPELLEDRLSTASGRGGGEQRRPSLVSDGFLFGVKRGLQDLGSAPTSPGSCRFSWDSVGPHDTESERLSPSCCPSWSSIQRFTGRSSQRSWADVTDEAAEGCDVDQWEFGSKDNLDDLLTPLPSSLHARCQGTSQWSEARLESANGPAATANPPFAPQAEWSWSQEQLDALSILMPVGAIVDPAAMDVVLKRHMPDAYTD